MTIETEHIPTLVIMDVQAESVFSTLMYLSEVYTKNAESDYYFEVTDKSGDVWEGITKKPDHPGVITLRDVDGEEFDIHGDDIKTLTVFKIL